MRHRTDHSITVRHLGGGMTTITDVYRQGVWVGWEVRREDASGATVRLWSATKKRGVVVQNLTSDPPTDASRRPTLEEAS
ncbi:Uncharacterised protein (plasmid) [Tsukamurella tyrosinosolvens]|uniref:Uncharacterized protein n=1 Tax=Tsukamurella tyrosinosolvens TaxID=57704 RepID=A0A1H4VSK1_TSUTY|nr:hypothetical protein [Tsukamurella tyrosinosolvens]KXO90913.1 hypothetical protein AXK58_20995 [Tsukamurella tyrosinosolvens]SEC83254.1 hypothetical protein SAMN04489793_3303 [Tsukamurella tyrosinosolvens]VEH90366.1 Uncharacterised protein [Tsukamurella tyrosinosolvens]